jgi:signal transduction histidine kinase
VFEPGFTTRGDRGGTGLGLPIVRRILEDAGGGIRMESVPGLGTRVHLWLPIAEAANQPS